MDRRDGKEHVAVLDNQRDVCWLAKVKWDKDHVCKNGLIGAWLLIALKKSTDKDWDVREKPEYLLGREDYEWEVYS